MPEDNGPRYRGWSEARINDLTTDVAEIKTTLSAHIEDENNRLSAIARDVHALRRWKAQVIGVGLAVTSLVGITRFVMGFLTKGD